MSFKCNVKLGACTVQVEAETIKDLFKEAGFFAEAPTECECGSKSIVPQHRCVKDMDFYAMLCTECQRTMPLGQLKSGGGLFFKTNDGWKEPYVRDDS